MVDWSRAIGASGIYALVGWVGALVRWAGALVGWLGAQIRWIGALISRGGILGRSDSMLWY